MTTKPLPETLAALEDFRARLNPNNPYDEEHKITLDAALAHLRSQEETVRRCAEIAESLGRGTDGFADRRGAILRAFGLNEKATPEPTNAILAAHGLKEQK